MGCVFTLIVVYKLTSYLLVNSHLSHTYPNIYPHSIEFPNNGTIILILIRNAKKSSYPHRISPTFFLSHAFLPCRSRHRIGRPCSREGNGSRWVGTPSTAQCLGNQPGTNRGPVEVVFFGKIMGKMMVKFSSGIFYPHFWMKIKGNSRVIGFFFTFWMKGDILKWGEWTW